MPAKRLIATYEQVAALAREWYGTVESMADMAERAIVDRGGHCLTCTCKSKLTADKPPVSATSLRSENLLVRVHCSIDPFRKYPFRGENVSSKECPSFKHHLRQQQKLEMPIR